MSNQENQNEEGPAPEKMVDEKQMNLEKVTILIPKEHAERPEVQEMFKASEGDTGVPGAVEMVAENITGEDLDKIGKCLFVGRAVGTPGKMCAQRLMCQANGQVVGHPADEMGRVSLGTNLDNLSEPIWLGINTQQFMLAYRSVLQTIFAMGQARDEGQAPDDTPPGKPEGFTAKNKSKVAAPGIQRGEPAGVGSHEEETE